ncbi:MAG: hypothetical protein PWQ93_373 [Clostridiales bacterium]|nr:hypothetical protein [Clostridiales bacterium]
MDPMESFKIEQMIKEVMDTEPAYIDHCHMAARFMHHYYMALVDEGFSDDDALTIVINHGIIPGGKRSI